MSRAGHLCIFLKEMNTNILKSEHINEETSALGQDNMQIPGGTSEDDGPESTEQLDTLDKVSGEPGQILFDL